jgi:predicted DNA-binding antitoxin AbrB/MazE fold protein
MDGLVKAVYEHGAFVPELPFDLPEGTLRKLVERMKANPLQPDAPRFTHDEMHERR